MSEQKQRGKRKLNLSCDGWRNNKFIIIVSSLLSSSRLVGKSLIKYLKGILFGQCALVEKGDNEPKGFLQGCFWTPSFVLWHRVMSTDKMSNCDWSLKSLLQNWGWSFVSFVLEAFRIIESGVEMKGLRIKFQFVRPFNGFNLETKHFPNDDLNTFSLFVPVSNKF